MDDWKDPEVNFPAHVKITDSFDYRWFNQITDYVLKLEERIHELEQQTGLPSPDGDGPVLADDPYIGSVLIEPI